jgi:hypothetical protein
MKETEKGIVSNIDSYTNIGLSQPYRYKCSLKEATLVQSQSGTVFEVVVL